MTLHRPRGRPRRQGNFYRRHFKPTVRAALPSEKNGVRFPDLRHTCASLLIAANVHPKAIRDHLGHADIQTTFNVYGHLLPSARDALGAALDAAYAGRADWADIPRIGSTRKRRRSRPHTGLEWGGADLRV